MATTPPPTPPPAVAASTAPKRSRKTRIVRRRGRARDDDMEDDAVIERAALSDWESDPTDGDSASEEEDEDPSPRPTADSPDAPAVVPDLPATPPADTASATTLQSSGPPSKEPSQLWSDEVAREDLSTSAAGQDLPVIDFAELSLTGNIEDLLNRKSPPTTTTTAAPAAESIPAAPAPKAKPQPHVPAHVVARQSYSKKLADPSFTPRVGQFWGHDDRLMDKGERPLSDWWRGRWATRGRGGGRGGFGGRGRGRGGGVAAGGPPNGNADEPPTPQEVEPINARWGHDGYEELSKQPDRNAGVGRGGGAMGRGRGWNKEPRRGGRGGARGGSNGAPSPINPAEKQAQLQADAAARMAARQPPVNGTVSTPTTPAIPPAVTTAPTPTSPAVPAAKATARIPKKQRGNDAKARLGDALSQAAIEREVTSAKSILSIVKTEAAAGRSTPPATPDKKATPSPAPVRVNLPKGPVAGKRQRQPPPHMPAPAPAASTNDLVISPPQNGATTSGPTSAPLSTDLQQQQQRHQRRSSDKDRSEAMERAILKNSFTKVPAPATAEDAAAAVVPPPASIVGLPLAPLPTLPSTNPAYSYVTLPPGIAMGDSGMLYEIATGRPVVLNQPSQPTPPLPPAHPAMHVPMYNPRPVPGRPPSFIPPHVLGGGGGSSTPGGYTSPGPISEATPNFFAPPKGGGRVQIRPPKNDLEDRKDAMQPKVQAPANNNNDYRRSAFTEQFGGGSGGGSSGLSGAASSFQPQPQPPAPVQQESYYNTSSYYPPQSSTPGAYGNQHQQTVEDAYYGAYYPPPQQAYGYPSAMDYGGYPQQQQQPDYGAYDPTAQHQQQQFGSTAQGLYYS